MKKKPRPTTRRYQPAEKVELWSLDRVKPYPNNPRTHSNEQIVLLAQLMLKWGIDQPIVVDEKGVILKGHGRRLAAFRAGITKVPVVVMRGLSEDDKRGLRIADNQVALLSGWDSELIKFEVTELQAHGFEVPLLGFSEKELQRFTSEGENGTQPEATFQAMYQVLIECENEQDQLRTIEKLQRDGIKCRALIA